LGIRLHATLRRRLPDRLVSEQGLSVSELFTVDNATAFLTLALLEIVLGIDNVVFIAILSGKLPAEQQPAARNVGLGLAMVMRIALLLAIGWVMGLTAGLFEVPRFWTSAASDVHAVSGRDLILLLGGLFLIGKATWEIHDRLEGGTHETHSPARSSFAAVIVQIVLIDIVFSLDSVITAVGMTQSHTGPRWIPLTIMISAVVVSVLVMLAFSGTISDFVTRHPTLKMLALSFLILIGVILVAEGLHTHIPKGYIYFAMAFSLVVELLNLRLRTGSQPVALHQPFVGAARPEGS
jgi:predicted tellurium resistance membrane protein TerC